MVFTNQVSFFTLHSQNVDINSFPFLPKVNFFSRVFFLYGEYFCRKNIFKLRFNGRRNPCFIDDIYGVSCWLRLIITVYSVHSLDKQLILLLHDLCLEVLTLHGNKLCLFMAKGNSSTLTINVFYYSTDLKILKSNKYIYSSWTVHI